jgi:hypothetical protein
MPLDFYLHALEHTENGDTLKVRRKPSNIVQIEIDSPNKSGNNPRFNLSASDVKKLANYLLESINS